MCYNAVLHVRVIRPLKLTKGFENKKIALGSVAI